MAKGKFVWTPPAIKILVFKYKQNNLLYNAKHPDYENWNKRVNIYHDIARAVNTVQNGCTANDVKRKLNRLRSQHLTEKMKALRRICETDEERSQRLISNQIRNQNRRANETEEERNLRLISNRIRNQYRRANESIEERNQRLISNRIRNRIRRANESEEKRNQRLISNRIRNNTLRAKRKKEVVDKKFLLL